MPVFAADPKFVARFRREARAVNRLRHPNIITIYDFGQLPDSRYFLSMEYAAGPSIRDLLHRGGRFEPQRALHVLGQLAYAVHHAHSRGVLHRDLKPDNLIVTGDDETLKVLDFGIAKIIASDQPESAAISNTNVVWGSPRYLAPERVRGIGDDPRSDLYSIGCIAYELVVGVPPFDGESEAIIRGHMSHAPAPPSTLCPGIPLELETTILRLLRKDPAERYQSAAEAVAALRKVPELPGSEDGTAPPVRAGRASAHRATLGGRGSAPQPRRAARARERAPRSRPVNGGAPRQRARAAARSRVVNRRARSHPGRATSTSSPAVRETTSDREASLGSRLASSSSRPGTRDTRRSLTSGSASSAVAARGGARREGTAARARGARWRPRRPMRVKGLRAAQGGATTSSSASSTTCCRPTPRTLIVSLAATAGRGAAPSHALNDTLWPGA